MELHAVGMLCALAAASFAAVRPGDRASLFTLAIGFAGAVLTVTPARFPEPAALGACGALVAALALVRPRFSLVVVLGAGVFAGVWVSVLRAQGLPFAPALVLAAALPASAWFAARRADFAPQVLREEALLLVGGLALVVAMAAEVVGGWRSAVALSSVPLEAERDAPGVWLLLTVVASVLLGGMYSLWRRR